jgi:hypothetical protein
MEDDVWTKDWLGRSVKIKKEISVVEIAAEQSSYLAELYIYKSTFIIKSVWFWMILYI